MPTQRDYLIATIMGEDNRADVGGMQGIIDVIANRADDYSRYGAKSGSYKDVVTARNGLEFNAWMPKDNNYDRTTRALGGLDNMRGAEVGQYKQAAKVVDDFLNEGVGRGHAQGATFYQTPTAPNKYQEQSLWPKFGKIQIGNHVYTGDRMIKDPAEYQAKFPDYFKPQLTPPRAGMDGFGGDVGMPEMVANPNFGSGIDPYGFDTVRNPSNPIKGTVPQPPQRPGDLDPRGPLDKFSDGITEGLEGAAGAIGGMLGIGTNKPPGLQDGPTIGPGADTRVIENLYQTLLGRPGDAAGVQAFDAELDSGRMDLNAIQQALMQSPEFAQLVGPPPATRTYSPTETLYARNFDRAPDAGGGSYFDAQFNAGTPQSILEAQILGSAEAKALGPDQYGQLVNNFQTQYGLSPDQVSTVSPLASQFAQATGRAADTSALQEWNRQINAGTPQSVIEAGILSAPEVVQAQLGSLGGLTSAYQQKYGLTPQETLTLAPAANQFGRLLGREVDAPTLQAWDAEIDAGTSMPTLLAQMLSAPEVQARGPDALAPIVSEFTTQYGKSPTDYLSAYLGIGPNDFSGANVSGGVASGSFKGFDPNSYLAANQDVARSGMDPLKHFMEFGLREGRAPAFGVGAINQNFDANAYLNQNRDVAASGMNPLQHYLQFGAAEGRAAPTGANPFQFSGMNVAQGAGPVGNGSFTGFDANSYLAANQDVKAAGMDPLQHYLQFGYNEGRSPGLGVNAINQGFDVGAYFNANPDVKAAGVDPLRHYLTTGAKEGRSAAFGGEGITPYNFSQFNVSGGVPAQSIGSGVTGTGSNWSQPFRPGFTGYAGSNGSGVYGDGAAIQERNSAISQNNFFQIEANNARNNAAAQEAAQLQQQYIGVNAPSISFTPAVFNPGTPQSNFTPPVTITPAAQMARAAPIAPPVMAFRPAMSGFGQFR